jgi:hypothetical protein
LFLGAAFVIKWCFHCISLIVGHKIFFEFQRLRENPCLMEVATLIFVYVLQGGQFRLGASWPGHVHLAGSAAAQTTDVFLF